MLHGKEAESEAIVGGKPWIRVSLQEYPTGPVGRFVQKMRAKLTNGRRSFMLLFIKEA
jgi:hypothetical protein